MADAHDKAFDATIERALKGEAGAGECPDVGVVAAYVERALGAAEASAFEAHAARCVACQAVMAAMVRAEDSASVVPARRPLWRNWRFIFAPALAAVAAVALVIALRLAPPGRSNKPMQRAAGAPMSQRAVEAPHAAMAIPAAPAAPVPAAASSAAKRRQSLLAESSGIMSEAAGARSGKSRPFVQFLAKSEVAGIRPRRAARPRVAAGERARPELTAPIVISSPDGRMMWRIGPGSQIARAEIPSPRPAAQTPIPQVGGTVAEQTAIPGAAAGRAVASQPAVTAAGPSARTPQTRSRFERLQTKPSWRELDSGVETDLLAASSPANDVCWVVGRDGTVIITVDGIHWHQIRSPVRADLVAVHATSLFAAEVVTADGRRFATTDGGNTWKTATVR